MAKLTPYDKEGKALREISQQLINPIIGQYDGDVQKALTGIRKKIRLNQATIREVAFVSLQEKGISISKEFADRKTGDYADDFALFKNNFPKITDREAPIAGSLTGGDSPSAAEFKSGMNSFINTHISLSDKQLKAGKVSLGYLGLDLPYKEFNETVSRNKEDFFITSKGERSKRKAADKTFLGYLTASLSKVVNEGKETGPDGNVILVRTDDLTAGYRGQGRTGGGFDKGLTAKSFVKMIQETISEIDKLPDVSDSDKSNAKIYTLLNSYMPSRPKALKDMMTSKPVKGSGFENRPYFEMSDGKGYLMFPEGYGGTTKSYVSTELPNNITNIFLTLQDKKQGAGAAVQIFDKDFTDRKLNNILSKTLGKVTAKPEYATVLGKEAPAKSMASFRKLTAGAMARSLNLPDLSGRDLHEFILAHGVDAKGEAYTKQMHAQTHGSILNAFQHVLASESGVDDLSKLNTHLGFDPVTTYSGALSEKVDPSKTIVDIDRSGTPSTVRDVELIPGVRTTIDDSVSMSEDQINTAASQDARAIADYRQKKLPLLQYFDSLLPTDPSGEPIFINEEEKLKFLDYFDNKAQLNTFLSENVMDIGDGSPSFANNGKIPDNYNVIDLTNLFKKAESIRSRTVPVIDASKGNILDQLKKLRAPIPKLGMVAGPLGYVVDLAAEMVTGATPVAKASMPLPADHTATQFADQPIDSDLFQKEIAELSHATELDVDDDKAGLEDDYLAQLQDIASQRPLTQRETDVDERSLLEGIQAKYPEPPQQQRREELRIDPFTSEGELKPKAFRGYTTDEHEYTELDPFSLGDERRRSIKAIEAADLESRELDDQMSTLMGEI